MSKIKFARAVLAAGTSLIFSVAPLFAAEASNTTTGAQSTNTTSISTSRSFTFVNTNTSSVVNMVRSRTISGENSASYNTGSGSVETGDATKTSTLSTLTNATTATVNMETTADPTVTNSDTGFDSDNVATVGISNTTTAVNTNEAEVVNDIDSKTVSGKNDADANTGDGAVDTGEATDDTGVGTLANTNEITVLGGVGDTTGDISNSNTGAQSNNFGSYTQNNTVGLYNTNNGFIANFLRLRAKSGYNSASRNTGDGSVDTKGSTVNSDLENLLNNNTAMVGDEDPVSSTFTGGNDWTGADSTNSSTGSTLNSLTAVNNNNQGECPAVFEAGGQYPELEGCGIGNQVYDKAVSGKNDADENTGSGSVDAGAAGVDASLSSTENWNELGFAGFGVNTDTFANSNTGFNSNNFSTATHTDLISGVNNNSGFLSNWLNNIAKTGKNSASNNTGDGSVESNDASVTETTTDAQNVNVFGPPTP